MPSIVSSGIVSLGICANAASVPVVLFANMQQEDPATPRSFVISKPAISKPAISNPPVFKTDCALDRCGKVLDPSRGTELPVAFIRIIDESAFFKRTALSVGWAEDVEPCHFESCHFVSCRNEMRFKRNGLSCYSGFTGISAEAFETDDLIEPTLPRKLGYGRNTGG